MTARTFADHFEAEAARLEREGMYRAETEHDACGVGFVAAIDGKPRREVVVKGIEALTAVWHRGAVAADGRTGDGAGIQVQIAQPFFKDHVARTGHTVREGRLAVGMVFLPRTDFAAQEAARTIVESEIVRMGHYVYGWRQVPVNLSVIGEKANETRPEIEQIMVANNHGSSDEGFERDLYVIRRRIEKRAIAAQLQNLYVCSLSCHSVVYKGMFRAESLATFYPDLNNDSFESAYAIYHQRYSTNTFPQWRLAQPFRMLAHNGEINTLKGNVNWMKSHEIRMAAKVVDGLEAEDIKPIVQAGSSDSAALDAVFELLVRAGRDAPTAKVLLVPEAWSREATEICEAHAAMYSYANAVMEPWDGPAALAMTDGRWVVGGMDRNGLRPMRYAITDDGLVIAGSEAGMVVVEDQKIRRKGRLGPGQMIGVDLEAGEVYEDKALKDVTAAKRNYSEWVRNIINLEEVLTPAPAARALTDRAALRQRLTAAGFSLEDMELLLQPMVEDAKEAIGSMGDDAPIAVLSEKYRPLAHYFRQNFSQVTNPPIDPLREHRVMSLATRFGNLGNVLDQDSSQTNVMTLDSPVVGNGMFAAMRDYMGDHAVEIDCTFNVADGPVDGRVLKAAIEKVRSQAEEAVRAGKHQIILSDTAVDEAHVAIPMVLAVGAVNSWLIAKGLRSFCSLNARVAECLDPHSFAVLIGVGATTVNAWLAEEAIADRHARGLFGGVTLDECVARFRHAIDQGLLKIMSKMGISVLSSYRGGYNFEALGLSRSLVQEFFPGLVSRISGIGLAGIEKKTRDQHARAYDADAVALPIGGLYRYRRGGETHALEGRLIHMLQEAVSVGSYSTFKRYSNAVKDHAHDNPVAIRDLREFRETNKPVQIDQVESVTSIRKRFVTPGMSLGALSPEAHKTLNIAMNRIGAKSDSGEGGEDPRAYGERHKGDNWSSAIKQVASGRFGVTAEYLNNCKELEIKIAQGAKPGEGGQLPGFKVTEMIAKLRHATPGVMLISPPPHHDIYSIEDLSQLIYDLKQINADARVTVKLVASTGVGTIAAGVAKAKADVILISGHNGGTGASPQTSIKFAGLPWEMGLSEANQVLILNDLRRRVVLRTDGGLKTGRDIVMAAMLGAEEYGVGTAALVAMGCIMVRQCHSNTCPVGVCVQDERLREKFTGTPEKVVNLFTYIAEEVREVLAQLGFRTLDEVIGRSDLLWQRSRGADHLDDLDLNPLLVQAECYGEAGRTCELERGARNPVLDTLDAQVVNDAHKLFSEGEKAEVDYGVRNTQRAIGARVASHIVRRFGMGGLEPGHLHMRLRGSAGQSLGAFAVQGMKIEMIGEANDYVGKGLSGGVIVVRPPQSTLESRPPHENAIIGNTVLYGATAGALYANGQAGERFAVRNSGARAVVEGCGANGCEYMTGGVVVILGPFGDNFAAGMTGGMAYVYDPDDHMDKRINDESVVYDRIRAAHWEAELRGLIEAHVAETGSPFARQLLTYWEGELPHFWQVTPKEMLNRLEHPLSDEDAAARA